jgi:hypothetical protein
MPSPGGQASGMAKHKNRCGWAWAGRVWHPASLPRGYHTTAQGQSHMTHAPVSSRAAPGCRVVGLRHADGMPHEPQRAVTGGVVVSSLVSSVDARLRSSAFGLMRRCMSRT